VVKLNLSRALANTAKGARAMESILDDRFVVFLRQDRSHSSRPDHAERPLASCSSYQEARRIQRQLQHTYRDCVIRYVGLTGGGD
jgi:hypothetical protein